MREPEKFLDVALHVIMLYVFLLVVFCTFAYESFGYTTKDIVILNLPHDNLSSTIQILYSFAMMATYPIAALPALSLFEDTGCF
jgi:amino acid permease